VTACWRRSPVSTYRLVNVPANPSGRFGASETEPGPSGVEDESIRIPFRKWYCLTVARRAGGIPGRLTLAASPGRTLVRDRAQMEAAARQARGVAPPGGMALAGAGPRPSQRRGYKAGALFRSSL
jgi:hypothetical protein